MSNIACENCGSEWFNIKKFVTIADEQYASGGVPRYSDGKTLYLCVDCGGVLDKSRLEHKPPDLTVILGANDSNSVTFSYDPLPFPDDLESYGPA